MNQDATLAGPRIFAVADGMGGHASGEVASAIAIASLAEADAGELVQVEQLLDAVNECNARIAEEARLQGALGMGTTIAGVAVCAGGSGDEIMVFNVGDSRVYRYRDGTLEQLSTDHSVTQELLDAERIKPEDVAHHPERHTVTRALGLEREVDVEWSLHEPHPGDRYLVCSDGLTNELDIVELTRVLTSGESAPGLAQALLDAALARGARDNVSVVVVDVTADAPKQAAAAEDDTLPQPPQLEVSP